MPNKGEPGVKYGVQLRHTTTAISTRIKKKKKKGLTNKRGAALAGQRGCPLPHNKRHGRKSGHKGRLFCFATIKDRKKTGRQFF